MPNSWTQRSLQQDWLNYVADFLHRYPTDHPVQISLRTYALAVSLSLSPPVMAYVSSAKLRAKGFGALLRVFRRELGVTGFAFAMTVAVGGGAALRRILEGLTENENTPKRNQSTTHVYRRILGWLPKLKSSHRTFVSYVLSASLAVALLQYPQKYPRKTNALSIPTNHRPSVTLDLTMLLFVRALDSLLRAKVLPSVQAGDEEIADGEKEKVLARRQSWTRRIDAFVFWASSARIMWCFFYAPQRLPRSYNKWIMSMANIDPRILTALRLIHSGQWSYVKGWTSQPAVIPSLSGDLGYPAVWGDVARLPAYGGPSASATWKTLGVTNRSGLGGLPCELVHGGIGGASCTANAVIRCALAFTEAVAIYVPVHVLPILLTKPRTLLHTPNLLKTFLSVLRSASFLSTFVSSIWFTVCLTRTLLLARLFHFIPHDFWDGPFGCTFAGSLICGASIWIEQGKRRGEMALYVLPRAIRACLSEEFMRNGKAVRPIERAVFVLSFAGLLTAGWHGQDSLRGLSRWTLSFILNGPNVAFWKRPKSKVTAPSIPPTNSHSAGELVDHVGNTD